MGFEGGGRGESAPAVCANLIEELPHPDRVCLEPPPLLLKGMHVVAIPLGHAC